MAEGGAPDPIVALKVERKMKELNEATAVRNVDIDRHDSRNSREEQDRDRARRDGDRERNRDRDRDRDRGRDARDRDRDGRDRERDRERNRDRDRGRDREIERSRSRERARGERDKERERYRDRDRDGGRDRGSERSRSRERARGGGEQRRSTSRGRRERSASPKKRESNFDKGPAGSIMAPGAPASVLMAALLSQVTNQARQSGVHPVLSVKARRVYVGNLPQGIGLQPKVLQEFFNTALVSAGLVVGEGVPINDVWISSEGRYAFLEMRSPQEATNAMKLDGISLYGVPLKVSRPHDYVPPTDAPAPHALLAALTGPSAAAAFSAPALIPELSTSPSSRFMAVTNVLCAEDLKDRRECGYIADDTRKKFNADFGSVLSVRVVLGSQPNVDAATQQVIAPFVGTILVEFADVATAELAKTRMVGFKFAKRSVTSRYVDGMTWGTIMTSGDCIDPIDE